jgi:fermentation-respiration switch protein FrsA (DUF1100 family)
MYFGQRALLYPGASLQPLALSFPAPWGKWERITTPDGEMLALLHTSAIGGRPTILLFPGNGDDIADYGFLAEAMAKHGYGLLAVSYRGYPGSTGSPTETGLLIDGLAAFDWLDAQSQDPIVIIGRSLGTGVAVNVAAERLAAAIVLISAYDSTLAVARGRYPFLPVGALMKDTFRSDLRIVKVSEPKLFVHGGLDQVVPLRFGQAIFAAAEPKRFSLQPGKGHNDIWTPATIDEVTGFINAVVPQAD